MADGNVVVLTESNFKSEILDAPGYAMVDFWGPGCPPCVRMLPMVEALAGEYKGLVKVGKLNVAEEIQPAMEFGIEVLPTLMIFNKGEVVRAFVGVPEKQKVQEELDKAKA